MASKEEKQHIIYKDTARILDELQMVYGVNNLYEMMCSYLNVSRYIQNLNMFSSDIDNSKISKLLKLKGSSEHELKLEISELITELTNRSDNSYNLYEYLYLLYKLVYNNDKCITMDEMIEYNKDIHNERFDNFVSKIQAIDLKCCDYKELDIKDNSFILLYPPFMKSNILSEKFNHNELFKWVRDKLAEQGRNVHIFVLAKEMPDDFIVYTDFSDKIKINKKDKNNLKLYVHKDSLLAQYDDSDISDMDF